MEQLDQVQKVVEATGADGLPDELKAQILAADVVLMIGLSDESVLTLSGTAKGGAYEPDQYAPHAALASIYREWGNTVRSIQGLPTDADRYRALRDFSMLGTLDPERFEAVNATIRNLEEAAGMTDDAGVRTAEQHDKFADIVFQALVENAPTTHDVAALEAAEDKRDRRAEKLRASVEGQGIILPPDAKTH